MLAALVLRLSLLLPALVAAAASRGPYDLLPHVNRDGIVPANDALMDRIFRGHRDYTVAVLLTAEGDAFQCPFCDILGPNFREVARNWKRDHPAGDGLFFVVADVELCRASFNSLGLSTAPNLAFYPPVRNAAEGNRGLNANHEFVAFQTINNQIPYLRQVFAEQGFDIRIVKPFPWAKFGKFVATLCAAGAASWLFWPQVVQILQAKQVWLALCLVAVIIFTSGHMFNVTRGTPMMGHDGQGQIQLFEPGFSSQFAIETQIVAVIYAVLSFATISLITRVPQLSKSAQVVGALVGTGIVFVGFSVLLETFRIKFYGYPYSLLKIDVWKYFRF